MKLRFNSARPLTDRDDSRLAKTEKKLKKLSEKVHLAQLKEKTPKALERRPEDKSSVKVTITGKVPAKRQVDSDRMKTIRAMRKMYNKAMPVLQCSGCAFSQSCPQFKPGYKCAFLPFLNSHSIDTDADLVDGMKNLAAANLRRAHLSTLMETLGGGAPTLETSENLNLAFMQLAKLNEVLSESKTASISFEGNPDSVITKIFGSLDSLLGATHEAQRQPIDVAPLIKEHSEQIALIEDTRALNVNQDLVREHTRDELEKAAGSKSKKIVEVAVSNLK